MPEHPLNSLQFAAALTAKLAAVWRRSWGVIAGKATSNSRQFTTADRRARMLYR